MTTALDPPPADRRRARGRTRRCPVGRAGRAAPRRDDPGGEGRPARQPLGRQRHAGRPADAEPSDRPTPSHVQRRADAGRVRGRRRPSRWRRRAGTGSATSPGSSAARPVTAAEGAAELVRQQRVVLDGSRLGIPALVHEECLTGFTDLRGDRLPGGDRLGRDLRPRPGRADGRRDRPRHGAPSACTRACPRCSTSCATTAGAGSRRPSARTPTSSRCSAPPTCAACRAPASSPP